MGLAPCNRAPVAAVTQQSPEPDGPYPGGTPGRTRKSFPMRISGIQKLKEGRRDEKESVLERRKERASRVRNQDPRKGA
ncbi:hypothetical protein NDU88_003118 [Pleurodeles waltl]|uniref:Uncharacterized protein n=1 Tax=Pleurodeles waltl TaxID=8319 RepID=A0AAV7PCW6_PLEWA|nr:hypothetical protein NDU88_003118 [Pleurodeles waltl]